MSTGTNGVNSSVSGDDDFELDDIRYTGNQRLSNLLHRRVPRDDTFWHGFDETVSRLAEKLDATMFRLDYDRVMQDYRDWRERIFEAAIILSQAGSEERPDLEQFVWTLLYLSHVVREICIALIAWDVTKVDLNEQFRNSHRHSAFQSKEDQKLAEDIVKAIEKCDVINATESDVAVALDVAVYSEEPSEIQEWLTSRLAEKQKERPGGRGHEAAEQRCVLARRSATISTILRRKVASQFTGPLKDKKCLLDGMMKDHTFFLKRTDICAAYIKSSRILEVYKVQEPTEGHSGKLKLIAVKHNVHGLSTWHEIAQQDFHLGTDGFLRACVEGQMCKYAWDTDMRKKSHWRGREYVPRKMATTNGENIVTQAMEDIVPESTGGWSFLMRGQYPGAGTSKEGFQTLELCTVVAGLALRFDSIRKNKYGQLDAQKEANWHTYENIKVQNSEALTVGHWIANTSSSGRSDNATKVSVIAAKHSRFWDLKSMWR